MCMGDLSRREGDAAFSTVLLQHFQNWAIILAGGRLKS